MGRMKAQLFDPAFERRYRFALLAKTHPFCLKVYDLKREDLYTIRKMIAETVRISPYDMEIVRSGARNKNRDKHYTLQFREEAHRDAVTVLIEARYRRWRVFNQPTVETHIRQF